MVANWSKAGSTAAPPHELNVWKFAESRAAEIQGLHSIVAERLENNFQSQRNKRRRTTGHDDRVAKKKFRKGRVGAGGKDKSDSVREDGSRLPRRVQRRIELTKNAACGFVTSGDGTKRLRTHVWHAKRFTMTKAWGFYIPLGLHGRGRGSRALLKKLKHGVLMHDASYYSCVQLEGSEDSLVSILCSVLVPSPIVCSQETWNNILDGASFGTAMIHHVGKPGDPPIAPVTYMWRSLQQINTTKEGLNIDVSDGEPNRDGSIIRQLWIWIHAAAFREAYDALCSATEKLVDTTSLVRCLSREGQLAKLELMGSKVFHHLQRTLVPVTSFENPWHMKKCMADKQDDLGASEKPYLFDSGDQISSSAVFSLVVKDPRTLTEKMKAIVPESKPFGHEEWQMKEQTFSSIPKNEADCALENGDLWDAAKDLYPPVEEHVLCLEKHQRRMEFIRLGHRSSGSQKASLDGKYSRVCPILLLKNEEHEDSVTRCSIILPLSWVKAFWDTFISNGIHAIGLREKHWVSCATGLPYWPLDFPDCNACSSFMALELDAFSDKGRLLPPSKRLLENLLPPPWDCVQLTLENMSSKSENSLNQVAEFGAQNEKIDMAKSSIDGQSESKNSDCQVVPFRGMIVRTSYTMNDLLKNTCSNKQLLFPKLWDQKSCLYKVMKDSEFLQQETAISAVNHGKRLFYLRVLICAYKEGVFEQGAVVCAPQVADIMLWTARSKSDKQNLQIPQSLVQLPSGTQQLQMPETLTFCESYRWPIGFITTGFVRGSKKPMAGALCEASLLSMLREEQWKAFPVRQRKKEIYVLVRNIRSTVYRLGLATVVLEKQEEDIKFM